MKRGFTLIEMIIAVAIFSLAMILLYDVINILNKTKDREIASYKQYHKLQELKRLFYQDMMYSSQLKIDNSKKIVLFKTKNSLYGYNNPYIEYILKKEILYRVESYQKLTLNLKSSELEDARVLVLLKNCKDILFFKDKKGINIYLKEKSSHIFKVNFLLFNYIN